MSSLRDSIDLNRLNLDQLKQLEAILFEALRDSLCKPTPTPTTETPSAVNWNSAPALNVDDVLAEAEAILAGCCPCCGSSNVQSSTMNGRRLYDCLDCGHSWEG